MLAREVPAAPSSAPIPPDGPGPASAQTLSAFASLADAKAQEAVRTARLAPRAVPIDGIDEPEAPDIHVPLPPERPKEPGAATIERPIDAPSGVGVPLPPRRPDHDVAALPPDGAPKPPEGPTEPDIELATVPHEDDPDCRALVSEGVVEAERIPPIEGPGVCGGGPLVSLTGVKRSDGETVTIRPAATLRCGMARALAGFLREDVAPAAAVSGERLAKIEIAGSFQCRGRNGASGGKMSEHGRANAVDLSSVVFADGRTVGIFSPDLPEKLSSAVKSAACERFSTVLGPGSDGFHEDHLHLDLQPRRSKAKLCQWADPEVARVEDKERDSADSKAEPESSPKPAAADDRDGSAREAARDKPSKAAKVEAGAPASGRRKAPRPDQPLPKRGRDR